MQFFNPLTIPLAGRQLIEASAGTGKTYCLALLYLRLLLERGLGVEQILVVTFTRAATEELRGRIRSRLRQALDLLEGREIPAPGDILSDLLAGRPDPEGAGQQLVDGLARMDEAAVYTIHGFCQRMLTDQAFEAGIPFDAEFIEGEQLLRRQIVEDFWRQRFYHLPPEEAEWVADRWRDPARLLAFVNPTLTRAEARFVPAITEDETDRLRAEAVSRWQEVRAGWRRDREEIVAILRSDPCLSRDRRSGYAEATLDAIFARMDSLAANPAMAWLVSPEIWRLATSEMEGRLKGDRVRPHHSFFALMERWREAHAALLRAAHALIVAAAHRFLQSELDRRKRQLNVLSFNDQLARLASALAGRQGQRLRERIRGRFAVALVDEFQDTDPMQYLIFQYLFGGEPNPALFMIGDPKQSIYSFRGADIFAYIRAQRETAAGAAHTMDRNYRSSPAMVQAVNRLFSSRPYFVFHEIGFYPVEPGRTGEAVPLLVDGTAAAPLQVQILPPSLAAEGRPRIAKERAEEAAAAWTAREIARLLDLGRNGQASCEGKPLAGRDVAVLVRTHREAEMVRHDLARLRVASVYYSQDSVFASEEAGEMARLLAALLDLADEALVSSALVTEFFGLDAPALHALRSEPLRWAETVAELSEYHQRWARAGVMAMLYLLLQRRRVVRRLLGGSDGERKLTNFLHLAELLQETSARLGMEELVRWLNQQRTAPDPDAASQQLRLESDGDLVRIVTIHKAKGLEYPVVFLPFLWSARRVDPNGLFPFHLPPKEGGEIRFLVDAGSGIAEHYRLAERERLAEDLRLLYVAMTRAKYCTFFCWGPILSLEHSALAWLLHPAVDGGEGVATDLSPEAIRSALASLAGGTGLLRVLPWPEADAGTVPGPGARPPLPQPPRFAGQIDTAWSVASYSRLLATGDSVMPLSGATGGEGEEASEEGSCAHTFPRGAAAGTVLHAILERLDFQVPFAEGIEPVADLLRRSGLGGDWAAPVMDWLAQVLATPLQRHGGLRLEQVRREDRLAELGFHFAVADLAEGALNELLEGHGIPPVKMESPRVSGLMKGYVDLVFRFRDRYYLVDYKSNYLGAAFANYREEAMAQAMAGHRYDVQCLIYTLALHRYLRRRLPGYAYDRHFGGAYYLFLRGMRPDLGPECGVWHVRPPLALVEGLDRCCGGRW